MLKKLREIFSPRKKKAESEQQRPPVHRGPLVVHREIARSDLDPDAVKIVLRLTRFDHSAYLVGGCVRDLLLERRPKDFDLGTSATPREVRRLFRNCRIIGRRFRLAHIYFQNGKIIEVATFRARNLAEIDGSGTKDKDGDLLIRDDNQFGTPEEDALRRDFTINSLFFDVNNGNVLDHAGGLADLKRKLVRTIGDPAVRFREDPIRILRAIKFAARLGFTIERKTFEALLETRSEIPKAAPPRVLEEINRFGREGAARRSFELLRETGTFEAILPELAGAYRTDGAWELLLDLMKSFDRERADKHQITTGEIMAALLLPGVGEPLGWKRDGTTAPSRGINVREIVDAALRPIALRLRVPRRDQEECRQILGILYRLVPASRMRPSLRKALKRRVVLPGALRFLDILAARYGGEFAESARSLASWKRESSARDDQPAAAARGGARRSRRGGRSRGDSRSHPGDSQRGESARSIGPAAPPAKERNLPKPWDDNYFFAALPNAPETQADDGAPDRYGATAVAGDATDSSEVPAGTARSPSEQAGPGTRRRRRRRRRRPAARSAETGDDKSGDHDE